MCQSKQICYYGKNSAKEGVDGFIFQIYLSFNFWFKFPISSLNVQLI